MFPGILHPTIDDSLKPILAFLAPSLDFSKIFFSAPLSAPCRWYLCSLWALRQIGDPRLAPQQAHADRVQWVPGLEASFKQAGIEKLLNICLACVKGDKSLRIRSQDVVHELAALKGMVAAFAPFHWTRDAVGPSLEPADTANLSAEAKGEGRSPRTEWHPDSVQHYTRIPVDRYIETAPSNGLAGNRGGKGGGGRRTGRGGRDRVVRNAGTKDDSAQPGAYGKKRERGRGAQHPSGSVDSEARRCTPGNANKRRRRTSNFHFQEEVNGARGTISSRPVYDHIKHEDPGTTRVNTYVVPKHDHL